MSSPRASPQAARASSQCGGRLHRAEGPREEPASPAHPALQGRDLHKSTKARQPRAPGRLGGWLPPWLLHQGLRLWLQETSGWGGHALGPLHDQPVPKASGSWAWSPGCFSGQRGSAPHFRLPVSPKRVQGSRGPCRL